MNGLQIVADILFAVLRVTLILFPLYLFFEGIGRRLDARTSARVGAGFGIGVRDSLKALTKSSVPGSDGRWLDGFFVIAVALFSLVPWLEHAEANEYELRLHLYFSLVILYVAMNFLLFLREGRYGRERFAAQEVFLFFLLLTPLALNEASLMLLRENGRTGLLHAAVSIGIVLLQGFLGLLLFYFPSSSKDEIEGRLGRTRPPLFHFSRFVVSMSWLCLHFSMIDGENRITLAGFALAFGVFVILRQVVMGYARFDGKVARVLTWKFFFPMSLTLFLALLAGGWR